MRPIAIMLSGVAIILIGCSRPTLHDGLSGTWVRQTVPEGEVATYAEGFTFHSDGGLDCLAAFEPNGILRSIGFRGSYAVSNDTIHMTLAMSDPKTPSTTAVRFRLLSPTSLWMSNSQTNWTFTKQERAQPATAPYSEPATRSPQG